MDPFREDLKAQPRIQKAVLEVVLVEEEIREDPAGVEDW